MEISLLDITTGQMVADQKLTLRDEVFARPYNEALIHQVVEAYRAAARMGTQAQKTRSEVSGGGIKPWRQKGTGRARAGTSRSPLWRGGGVAFAAKPRSYQQKINKKMYSGAICSILSELLRTDRLMVTGGLEVSGKTKELSGILRQAGFKDGALIVTDNIDVNLYLAARNLRYTDVLLDSEINPYDLLAFDKLLFTLPALRVVEERLS